MRSNRFDIVELDDGIELRMWLAPSKRRSSSASGGGISRARPAAALCGIDSIAEAVRPAAIVAQGRSRSRRREIMAAMAEHYAAAARSTSRRARCMPRRSGRRRAASLRCARMSAATTHSTSSPARWRRTSVPPSEGIVLLTSRVSVEMVQKTAAIGAPRDGCGVGADGARGTHGRRRRHHARRHRARGRI